MSDVFDGFGDVLEGTNGIFGGSDGLQAYDSVQHQYGQEGLIVQIHCESCGKPRHMTVMWPELCAIKFNVFRGVLPEVLSEGTHVLIPLVERPIIFDVRTRPRAIKSTTGTRGACAAPAARPRRRRSGGCHAPPRRLPPPPSLLPQTCRWWTLGCAC